MSRKEYHEINTSFVSFLTAAYGSQKYRTDIGANLTDAMYQGIYNGSQKHQPDLDNVLERAFNNGLKKIIITGMDLVSSRTALEIALKNDLLYTTIGCHPTRCDEFDKSGNWLEYLNSLAELIRKNCSKVVAVGECGLDYDRLHFCKEAVQQKYFEKQLEMCKEIKKPLFLHCRNAADDFIRILQNTNYSLQGVVHSFDGTLDNMNRLIDFGLYIGINGCSLKTEQNLDIVKSIPKDRLLLETDCPWCEIRPSHAGFKYVKTRFPVTKKEKWKADCLIKSRNEPSNIVQVLEIVSAVREEDTAELCEQIYKNTETLFFSC